MKVKVSEATLPQLNWMVATAEGYKDLTYWPATGSVTSTQPNKLQVRHDYADSWAQGGPIIEREKIDLQAKINAGSDYDEWLATIGVGAKQKRRYGPTPLVAAMRCYVASKLGEEVDVPEELK